MASGDGARSAKSSSEEGFQFECGPCENDGITTEAKYFCPDCKDYLCEPCETSHKRFKSTRRHTIMTVSLMSANEDCAQVPDSSSIMCLCYKNVAEMYCKYHDEVFCSDCKTIKHRLCQTLLIDDMVNELDQNFGSSTLDDAIDLKGKFMDLQTIQKQDREKLIAETESCKNGIELFKNELVQHIYKIEENALNGLQNSSSLHSKVIDQHLGACNTALSALSVDYDSQVASKDGRRKFIANFKLRRTLQDLNAAFGELHEERRDPCMSFNRSTTLSVVLDTDSFGVLNHNLPGQCKRFSAAMKVQMCREMNIKMPSDEKLPWISGSAFLPEGNLVLCDIQNKCLKVFDQHFEWTQTIMLTGMPRDCCLLNGKLFVTVPEKKQIQCFQILPLIQLENTIHLDRQCEGVAALHRDIFLTCHEEPDKEIRIIDQDGELKKSIILTEADRQSFQIPHYISVADTGEIIVSEASNADFSWQIRCFTKDGHCNYCYSEPQLKGAVGSLIDVEGRVLICFWRSNTVRLVSNDSVNSKDYFEPNMDLTAPYTISYRGNDDTLVVTFRDRSNILICKLSCRNIR